MANRTVKEITVQFTPTLQEILLAARALRQQSAMFKVDVVMVLLTVAFAFWFGVVEGLIIHALLNLVAGALILLNSLFPLRVWLHYRLNPQNLRATTVYLDAEGARFVTDLRDRKTAWNEYRRVIETQQLFIFLLANVNAYQMIPKRALAGTEPLDTLRSLLRSNIGQTGSATTKTAAG
jgi:hypothetical protein